MNENGIGSELKPIQQSVYSIDNLINSFTSLDEEQQEVDELQNKMIVPSIDCLFTESSIFNTFPLPIGFIIQPNSRNSSNTQRCEHSPVCCECCGAIASSFSEFYGDGCWKCAFCQKTSSIPYDNVYINKNKSISLVEQFPELSDEVTTVEYVSDSGNMSPLYSPTNQNNAIIFIIDRSLNSEQFVNIQKSLSIMLSKLSLSSYYIGLIVFGDIIEIYELGGIIGEADIYSGSSFVSSNDEQYIRFHEREGSDRQQRADHPFVSYLAPLDVNDVRFLNILSTFSSKNDKIHPVSMVTFLAATKYAQLLLSTGVFASSQIVICTQGFLYDIQEDPYLQYEVAEDDVKQEIGRQKLFCYQNRIVIDYYISGCMYSGVNIIKTLISPLGGSLLLLSDSFQTDFINCLCRSLHMISSSCSVVIHLGDGIEVDRILGSFISSSVQKNGDCSVVTVELGRTTSSTSIALLVSSSIGKRSVRTLMAVDGIASVPVQVEVSYRDGDKGFILTRRETWTLRMTSDRNEFLEGVSGCVTAALIAKDVCSNLDTSVIVTENVKNGIDCLLSQVLRYYRTFYVPTSSHQIPAVIAPPVITSTIPPSSSYSSFYSYTRTVSRGEVTTIIDPFDNFTPSRFPQTSSYASFDAESLSTSPGPHSDDGVETGSTRWSWFFSLFSRTASSANLTSFSTHRRSPSVQNAQYHLPHQLRCLPLYMYYLRRGCLFGDCFHNGDLLQLHRLRIASASLQDTLRIILPRLVLARDTISSDPTAILSHIKSMPVCSLPPPSSMHAMSSSCGAAMDQLPSQYRHKHFRSGNKWTTPSIPIVPSESVVSMPYELDRDIRGLSSEVIDEANKDMITRESTVEIFPSDDVKTDDDNGYFAFVAEGDKSNTDYFIEKTLVSSRSDKSFPDFCILPPETMALLSDSIVILDTQREIYIWIGADRPPLEQDPVYNSCLFLALSLTQTRTPPSIIRVVRENTSNSRFVLCNLIPSHKDPLDVCIHSLPVLSGLRSDVLKNHAAKFLRMDDVSFREYMAKIYHLR